MSNEQIAMTEAKALAERIKRGEAPAVPKLQHEIEEEEKTEQREAFYRTVRSGAYTVSNISPSAWEIIQ